MIDLHCHILPGLDDGAQDLDQAVEMARIAQEDGIRTIVGTPHLFRGTTGLADPSVIEENRARLAGALEERGIRVKILAGAEVHITHGLMDTIRREKSRLTVAGSAYMFVEFPHDHVFSGAKDLFFEIMSEQLIPIIAHPERNTAFIRSPRLLYELIALGALVQINAGSFLGHHGSEAYEAVHRYLQFRFVHFISSDGHNTRSKAPRLAGALKAAARIIGEAEAAVLVSGNPEAVIRDKEIPFRPDPIEPDGADSRFKIKLPGFLKFGK
jgi:protein-tyrosine phosphatase